MDETRTMLKRIRYEKGGNPLASNNWATERSKRKADGRWGEGSRKSIDGTGTRTTIS